MKHLQYYLPLTLLTVSCGSTAQLAYDMVGSTSANLTDFTQDYAEGFSSAGDGFGKYQRGVDDVPFALLDDTLAGFPTDSLGIIGADNTDIFFGVTDTVNSDTNGPLTATWTFAMPATSASCLAVSLDVGAMGDFEASDYFEWRASVDGSDFQTLFTSSVNEDGSQVYLLENGDSYELSDPMLLQEQILTNTMAQFEALTPAGSTLTLQLETSTDGGSEAFAFQNLIIDESLETDCSGGTSEPGVLSVKIHEVQGSGESSLLTGETVSVEGVVVGDFQAGDSDDFDLAGFYVQEEDADADANPATSEGVFVYDGSGAVDVQVGDLVRVTGEVSEYNGLTQISVTGDSATVEVVGQDAALPVLTDLTLPVNSLDDLEAYEGMRVRFPQRLVISEFFNFDRYGEIVLAKPLNKERRLMVPTAVRNPGSNGYEIRAARNLLSKITLDDGRSSQNPDPAMHPNGEVFSLENRFRGGDVVANATGVLDYRFDLYRVQPTAGADYRVANPRPKWAPAVGGQLKVSAFNVLNYFTSLDDGNDLCGPSGGMECRGADADQPQEFERQRAKVVTAIKALNADVVGLIEVENNPSAAVADLVDGLNEATGSDAYRYIDTGTIGTDAIKVALIYKRWKVKPVGDFAVLNSDVDARFIDDKNRPALAQSFADVTGGIFTVAVNHLKSKGSDCEDIGDVDLQDGQGNCNHTRTLAAEALAEWLDSDPTNSGSKQSIIVGDLNSYDHEDPISTLQDAGFVDLVKRYGGPFAYSYVYDGEVGYLDHALASRAMVSRIRSAKPWHINADEPDILDYDTSFKLDAQDALFEPNAYRSSDHDPILIGLVVEAKKRAHCRGQLWKKVGKANGATFKNRGACLRYVKTGR